MRANDLQGKFFVFSIQKLSNFLSFRPTNRANDPRNVSIMMMVCCSITETNEATPSTHLRWIPQSLFLFRALSRSLMPERERERDASSLGRISLTYQRPFWSALCHKARRVLCPDTQTPRSERPRRTPGPGPHGGIASKGDKSLGASSSHAADARCSNSATRHNRCTFS